MPESKTPFCDNPQACPEHASKHVKPDSAQRLAELGLNCEGPQETWRWAHGCGLCPQIADYTLRESSQLGEQGARDLAKRVVAGSMSVETLQSIIARSKNGRS